jgi:hypothetical protein
MFHESTYTRLDKHDSNRSTEINPDLCALLAQPDISIIEDLFRQDLTKAGVSGTTANELIACLRDVGVVFT